jgi:hypothetical protein
MVLYRTSLRKLPSSSQLLLGIKIHVSSTYIITLELLSNKPRKSLILHGVTIQKTTVWSITAAQTSERNIQSPTWHHVVSLLVGSEVLTAVIMKSSILWDISSCSLATVNHFQRTTRHYNPEDIGLHGTTSQKPAAFIAVRRSSLLRGDSLTC